MHKEQQSRRDAANAELETLVGQRDEAVATLTELRDSLGRAIGVAGATGGGESAERATVTRALGAGGPAACGPATTGQHPETSERPVSGVHQLPRESPTTGERPLSAEMRSEGHDNEGGDPIPVGGADSTEAANMVTAWHPAVVFDDTHRPGVALSGDEGAPAQEDQAALEAGSGPLPGGGPGSDFDVKLEAWVSEGARHFRRD